VTKKTLAHGRSAIKLFSLIIDGFQNKLGCLSLASFFMLVYHFQEQRDNIGSDKHKHSSLFWHSICQQKHCTWWKCNIPFLYLTLRQNKLECLSRERFFWLISFEGINRKYWPQTNANTLAYFRTVYVTKKNIDRWWLCNKT
jgi:hypothetical protein